MKLRKRLILSYTILAFLASFTLAVINNYYQVQKNGANAENMIHTTSNQLINTLDVSINQMKQVSLLLLSDQDVLQAIRNLSVIMEDTKDHELELNSNKSVVKSSIYTAYNYENFFRVIVFNSFGYISASSTTQKRIINPATNVSDIKWLDKVKNTTGVGILIPLHLDDWGYEGRKTSVFSLVKEIQGKNLGYIEVQQTEEYLEKILTLSDNEDQMILLSEDGSVFYSNTEKEINEYQQYFTWKEQIFRQKNEKNGKQELISIQESAATGIKLILIRDWDVINNSIVSSGIRSAVTMGLIFLVLSLLFIIAVANLVTRPLRELREQIENTKLSNMNQNIRIHSSDEDMLAFAESFQNLMNRLAESMEKEKMLSVLQLQAQFDTLQAQVNPHFLYNVLNVISSRGMQNDDEVIGEVCGHLAAMLRYSTNTKERYATIRQEMEYLDYYIYLLQARFETRLEVSVDIDERLNECVVPKILIQQLVENSIEHGFVNITGVMQIKVRGYWNKQGWTMYKVMIVDDEPAAITYLSAIIEKKCEGFAVSDTAMDGEEALEKIVNDCPDVLLFDIQMPLLNGLEMTKRIQELDLSLLMVAVSGYSQFDYAISAMKNGAVDYLLKPAMPSEVEKLFVKLRSQLQQRYFQAYVGIMRSLCNGHNIAKEKICQYFGTENYYIALARQNGLPMRFSSVLGKEVYSDIHEIIYAYGRDERESLYLWPENLVINEDFQKLVRNRMAKDSIEDGYHTLIYSSEPVNSDNLAETIKRLYRLLDRNIILEKDCMIDICNYQEPVWDADNLEKTEWRELVYCLDKQDIKKAKEHLANVIGKWKQQERPLLWIERRVRQLSSSLMLAKVGNYDKNYQLNEYVLEDIFGNSYTYAQLVEGISSILFPSVETIQKEEKLDTSEFVDQISDFMVIHMEENLNVQQISKEFSISPTYLGKLFRKHKNMTMNNFLTSIRIERAKELLQRNPNIMIRELAQRIGYQDQFYFSRVFRSYTGVSPSEYSLSVMKEN